MVAIDLIVGKMEAQLERRGTRLDDVSPKAADAGADAKVGYRTLVDDLKAKLQAATLGRPPLSATRSQTYAR